MASCFRGHKGDLDVERCRKREIPIVVIGTAGSGKSTVIKQFEKKFRSDAFQTHMSGQQLRDDIRAFTRVAMVRACRRSGPDNLDEKQQRLRQKLCDDDNAVRFFDNLDMINTMKLIELWAAIKKNPAVFYSTDPETHFLEKMKDTLAADYKPTEADYLKCRQQTTEEYERLFGGIKLEKAMCPFAKTKYHSLRITDVRGDINQRGNWLRPNARIYMYVASLADYDLLMAENDATNRLDDSIREFHAHAPQILAEGSTRILILLFNKKDLFLEKIAREGLENHFEDYEGGAQGDPSQNAKDAEKFIKGKFENNEVVQRWKQIRYFSFTTSAIDQQFRERIIQQLLNIFIVDQLS